MITHQRQPKQTLNLDVPKVTVKDDVVDEI